MANIHIKQKYLSGNRIAITITDLPTGTLSSVKYIIEKAETVQNPEEDEIFSGVVYSYGDEPLTIDLSDIFTEITDCSVKSFSIRFIIAEAHIDTNYQIQLYGGAISKTFERVLREKNTDIFQAKLFSDSANFLLSTRSFGTIIMIPENELMPLCYYKTGAELYAGSNSVAQFSGNSINLEEIRKQTALTTGVLHNVFDVKQSGSTLFSIVITEAYPADYFLIFKNSLNAFEKIGIRNIRTKNEVTADFVYQWDNAECEMIKRVAKKRLKTSYTATSEYYYYSNMLFITDLLMSKEVYMTTASGSRYPVTVTANGGIVQSTDGTPYRIELEIEQKDENTAYSPLDMFNIRTGTENASIGSTLTRVFTHHFNEIYN